MNGHLLSHKSVIQSIVGRPGGVDIFYLFRVNLGGGESHKKDEPKMGLKKRPIMKAELNGSKTESKMCRIFYLRKIIK